LRQKTSDESVDNPKVSVIIPFHDRIQWVGNAVESVLRQTYSDFEVILIDDGSAENIEILRDQMESERIRYFRQRHTGVASARNRGMQAARGKYIAFLDSDDMFLPHKLEKQVQLMENIPNVSLSHTSYRYINQDAKGLDEVRSGKLTGVAFPRVLFDCPIATPTVMIRSEIFKKGFMFNESVTPAEDIILWCSIARISKIAGIDETLSLVRKHEQFTYENPAMRITGLTNVINHFTSNVDPLLKYRLVAYLLLVRACRLDISTVHEAALTDLRSLFRRPFDGYRYASLLCHVARLVLRDYTLPLSRIAAVISGLTILE
jgi:glycosyltransferase involved in cell wall biosynthesis